MLIEEHVELYYKNLISFRKTITQNELQNEMEDLNSFINQNNLTIVGPKISTTYSINQTMNPTMDIEILIPIDKSFKDNEKFKFKPELKLVNAIKYVYKGNPKNLNNSIVQIQNYIEAKNLIPITSLYTINMFEAKNLQDMNKFSVELYLGINPNIL